MQGAGIGEAYCSGEELVNFTVAEVGLVDLTERVGGNDNGIGLSV